MPQTAIGPPLDVSGHGDKATANADAHKHKDGLLRNVVRKLLVFSLCDFIDLQIRLAKVEKGSEAKETRGHSIEKVFSHSERALRCVRLHKHRHKLLLPLAFVFLAASLLLFLWRKHFIWFKWFYLNAACTVRMAAISQRMYTCKRSTVARNTQSNVSLISHKT